METTRGNRVSGIAISRFPQRIVIRRRVIAAAILTLLAQCSLYAQSPAQEPESPSSTTTEAATLSAVEVVGTQIKGGAASEALLPVVGLPAMQIEALGVTSGDDLFRSIPQMGEVTFRNSFGGNSSNFVRGDVGSINLRNLGVGNTLLLINGRRTAHHPASQADDDLVPVLTYNANTIPVANLRRVDVLLNGASAIYGTDAVAGVVNNVLRDDVDGGTVSVQYGFGEGTKLRDRSINGMWGRNFADMRGNFTLAYNLQDSTGLRSWDQGWTSTDDRRFDFVGTDLEGNPRLDLRSVVTRWGTFIAQLPTPDAITSGGAVLTTNAGLFHVQPGTSPGCGMLIGDNICVQPGALATAGADRDLRYDVNRSLPVHFQPKYDRVNLFATAKYDFDNGVGIFSELGIYRSRAYSYRQPVNSINSLLATVAASGYWNPFGARLLPDGSENPNRLPGLNIPDEGVDITIRDYRFEDPVRIWVDNVQLRGLFGLRGYHFGWDWESALLFSQARVRDMQNSISSTQLEASMARSTPDAYNPFGGVNSQQTIDAISFTSTRRSQNTLMLWDFKTSRPDLFKMPAGDFGIAAGVEARHERQLDDRDPHLDGTIVWNQASGGVQQSDQYGISPTLDIRGSRSVGGVYAEAYLPLVSPEWGIPLVRNLDMQIAGRAEHYSDFGRVAKPKVALGWEITDQVSMRFSWSKGFRAPNLEQINIDVLTRANRRTDHIQCEALVRSGQVASHSVCDYTQVVSIRREGNPDLQPETSNNISAGIVFEPTFLPDAMGRLSLSLDYYKYEQEGIVGLFGEVNSLILDYIMRVQGIAGGNPNIVREAPTADDVARFAGTGLEPAGAVLFARDRYDNRLPQTVRGLDFGINWTSPETRIGRLTLSANGNRLLEYFREVPAEIQALFDAGADGTIDSSVTLSIAGYGDRIMRYGKVRWKWTGNLFWDYGNFQLGTTGKYVGDFYDTGLAYDGRFWQPGSSMYWNAFGKYNFDREGFWSGTSIKLGVNNLDNRRPPRAADASGYLATIYTPMPRYWYVNLTKEF